MKSAAESKLPILVTENGIATGDDRVRCAFLHEHVLILNHQLSRGAPIEGYFYWSLLDNFEWALGYRPTFGLIACDRTTFERKPKPSAVYFGEICRANAVDPKVTAGFLE